ncbi:hypothetical protein BDP27DRAFT_1413452 [Rhodocollybia butyracea]|uniref:Uncharacterized protein n=1 Tax=Rhodocollybia butyracea TaxID=206335 RepID=A0A9P5UGR6_9AGAR|nr:hypothetical protein BDP27DRAFT_1413452 [Rhodocollybia butyracea]
MGRIEVEGMEICYGRFLVVQGLHAMFVYDLNRETEVFRYTAFEDDELSWAYSRSEVVNLELDLFFPFAATPSEEANREPSMSMCKISPSGFVTIRDWPGQSVDASFFVGTEFVIIEEFDPAPIRLIHLASMKAYPMSSRYMDEINNYPSLTITAFVPGGYVLLCFTDEFEGSLRDHYFELYCLPDPALLPGGTALYPTHRGHYHHSEDHFESGRFLSSNVSTNGLTGSIYLVVHLFKKWRLCFLRVMLQEDGNLILRLDNTDLPEVFWETPSPSNSVTRVRDVAFMRDGHRLPGEEDWLLCDMHMDSEGEPCVRTSKVTIPAEPAYHVLCLDIFRGRLISAGYHKGDSSREEIRFLEIGCPNPVDGHPLSTRVA